MQVPAAEPFKLAAQHYLNNAPRFMMKDAVTMAWSAVVADSPHAAEFLAFACAKVEKKPELLDRIGIFQLYQAAAAAHYPLPEPIVAVATKAISDHAARPPHASPFERAVQNTLTRLGIPFQTQVHVKGFFLDFVVNVGSKEIVLECDGSRFHQVGRTFRDELRGNGLLRDRVLKASGYDTVIHLSDEEWETIGDLSEWLQIKVGAGNPSPLRSAALPGIPEGALVKP